MNSRLKKLMSVLVVTVMLTVSSSFALADTAIDTIMNVGTTQAFTDETVSSEDLETIARAGLAAASAINQQPWHFVIVTNQDVMKEIAGSGMRFAPPANASQENAPKPMDEADGQAEMPKMPPAPAGNGAPKAGLGDTPAAIIIYKNGNTASPDASFDCGLAAQNMYIAAASLGYGVKIVSSPTMALNGNNHDALCEKLGVDTSMQAVAVLLIGHKADSSDSVSSATLRESYDAKVSVID